MFGEERLVSFQKRRRDREDGARRAREEFGWRPRRSAADIVEDCVRWIEEHREALLPVFAVLLVLAGLNVAVASAFPAYLEKDVEAPPPV